MPEERHPHIIAKEAFEQIVKDQKFSDEERAKARLHVMVLDGIIDLATRITQSNNAFPYPSQQCIHRF